jgi:hypothetical protein
MARSLQSNLTASSCRYSDFEKYHYSCGDDRRRNLPSRWYTVFIVLILLLVQVPLVSAASLVNGGVVSDAISAPGEQDSYTFTASVGESV